MFGGPIAGKSWHAKGIGRESIWLEAQQRRVRLGQGDMVHVVGKTRGSVLMPWTGWVSHFILSFESST